MDVVQYFSIFYFEFRRFVFIIFSYWIDAFLLVATKIDGNYLFLKMPSMGGIGIEAFGSNIKDCSVEMVCFWKFLQIPV